MSFQEPNTKLERKYDDVTQNLGLEKLWNEKSWEGQSVGGAAVMKSL